LGDIDMADVVNRITKQFLKSVNTPDYPRDAWIINPNLSGVLNVPVKYWKIVGDIISEMSQPEKDEVDANEPIPLPRGNSLIATFTGIANENENRFLASDNLGSSDYLPAVCMITTKVTLLVFSNASPSPAGMIELRVNTTEGEPAATVILAGTQTQIISLNLSMTQGDTINCKISSKSSKIDNPVIKLYATTNT